MISDMKRREVAQELRELRHTTYYREEVVENICDVISIADPVNTFREPEDVYKLLADLIEPVPDRTCRMIDNGAELCCSECDWRHDYDDEPKFCAGCGAEIVRTSD